MGPVSFGDFRSLMPFGDRSIRICPGLHDAPPLCTSIPLASSPFYQKEQNISQAFLRCTSILSVHSVSTIFFLLFVLKHSFYCTWRQNWSIWAEEKAGRTERILEMRTGNGRWSFRLNRIVLVRSESSKPSAYATRYKSFLSVSPPFPIRLNETEWNCFKTHSVRA